MLGRLKENRDFCLTALRKMPGVTVPSPDGAFYLFPKIDGLTDSFAFCRKLLEETKVGVAPGVAFGAGGEGSVRSVMLPSARSWSRPWRDSAAFYRNPGEEKSETG